MEEHHLSVFFGLLVTSESRLQTLIFSLILEYIHLLFPELFERLQLWGRLPTLSLCSFRLTITAVICWSINIRMVTSRAGSEAARYTHQGFPPKGGTNQPLIGLVGWTKRRRRMRPLKVTWNHPVYHPLSVWTWITSQTEQNIKVASPHVLRVLTLNSLKLLEHHYLTGICDLRLYGQTKLALCSQPSDPLCSHITYNQVVIRCRHPPLLYPIIPFLCVEAERGGLNAGWGTFELLNLQDWLSLGFR